MNEALLQRLEREAEKITLDMPASLDDKEFTPVFNAEFAELIVRECVRVIEETPLGYGDYRDQILKSMRDHCAERVAEHFTLE